LIHKIPTFVRTASGTDERKVVRDIGKPHVDDHVRDDRDHQDERDDADARPIDMDVLMLVLEFIGE